MILPNRRMTASCDSPVVTAWRWHGIAAEITVCAWVGVSLVCSKLELQVET